MSDDPREQELCICYHVSFGKVVRFTKIGVRKGTIRRASQISQCYGAGTGCGWCVPFLEKVYEAVTAGDEPEFKMSSAEYRQRRAEYHKQIGWGKKDDPAT